MKFKKDVDPTGIRPELMVALFICDSVYREVEGIDLVVTSLNDGKHSFGSLHFSGAAADLRIWNIDAERMVNKIKIALGSNSAYDVVLESDHIHLEWQPKSK